MFTKDILQNYARLRLEEPEKSRFEAAIANMQLETRGSLMEVVTPQEIERVGFAHLIDDLKKNAYRLVPVQQMTAFHEMNYMDAQAAAH